MIQTIRWLSSFCEGNVTGVRESSSNDFLQIKNFTTSSKSPLSLSLSFFRFLSLYFSLSRHLSPSLSDSYLSSSIFHIFTFLSLFPISTFFLSLFHIPTFLFPISFSFQRHFLSILNLLSLSLFQNLLTFPLTYSNFVSHSAFCPCLTPYHIQQTGFLSSPSKQLLFFSSLLFFLSVTSSHPKQVQAQEVVSHKKRSIFPFTFSPHHFLVITHSNAKYTFCVCLTNILSVTWFVGWWECVSDNSNAHNFSFSNFLDFSDRKFFPLFLLIYEIERKINYFHFLSNSLEAQITTNSPISKALNWRKKSQQYKVVCWYVGGWIGK